MRNLLPGYILVRSTKRNIAILPYPALGTTVGYHGPLSVGLAVRLYESQASSPWRMGNFLHSSTAGTQYCCSEEKNSDPSVAIQLPFRSSTGCQWTPG